MVVLVVVIPLVRGEPTAMAFGGGWLACAVGSALDVAGAVVDRLGAGVGFAGRALRVLGVAGALRS